MKRDLDQHFWIILDPNGCNLPWTLSSWRWGAMKKHINNSRDEKPWDYYYRRGYRCRKVTLVDGWKEVDDECMATDIHFLRLPRL